MVENAEQVDGYNFNVSSETQRILSRLKSTATQTLGPNSFLLEELFSSLKRDQYVLQSLHEEIGKYKEEDVSPELLFKADGQCFRKEIECDIIGANSALLCGANEKAMLVLQKLAQKDMTNLPDDLKAVMFTLFVSTAWITREYSIAESFLQTAKKMDASKHYSKYLEGVSSLLQARSELDAGRSDVAIRICQALSYMTKSDKSNEQIVFLALEIQADAFKQMDDIVREQKVLEDWENSVRAYPNGPCDLAVIAERTKGSVGILGGSRSEEILQHYSRLAFLYEQNSDTRDFAKGIYIKFMNSAHHNWVDSVLKVSMTIEQRLSELNSPIKREKLEDSLDNIDLYVVEPERTFGKVSEKVLEDLIETLTTIPTSSFYAVAISQVDMKERNFSIQSNRETPSQQLFNEILKVFREQKREAIFDATKISVLWKKQEEEWIWLSHQEQTPDIKPLSFGLRVVPVGDKMDIAMYVLYKYSPPLDLNSRQILTDILRRKVGELQGYCAIEDLIMNIVKRAARRVEQKACDTTDVQEQKGPIRL